MRRRNLCIRDEQKKGQSKPGKEPEPLLLLRLADAPPFFASFSMEVSSSLRSFTRPRRRTSATFDQSVLGPPVAICPSSSSESDSLSECVVAEAAQPEMSLAGAQPSTEAIRRSDERSLERRGGLETGSVVEGIVARVEGRRRRDSEEECGRRRLRGRLTTMVVVEVEVESKSEGEELVAARLPLCLVSCRLCKRA
jgi:hypothetical protein